jgi:hypothetical protein
VDNNSPPGKEHTMNPFARHVRPITVSVGLLFLAGQLAVLATLDRSDLQATGTSTAYRASTALLLLGFAGLLLAAGSLYSVQATRAGTLGVVGVCGAMLGTFLLGGDLWFETFGVPWYAQVAPEVLDIKGSGWLAAGALSSYLLFAAGWALLGVASYRARVLHPLWSLALVVGGLVGYGAALPPYGIPLALALVGLGMTATRSQMLGGHAEPMGVGGR